MLANIFWRFFLPQHVGTYSKPRQHVGQHIDQQCWFKCWPTVDTVCEGLRQTWITLLLSFVLEYKMVGTENGGFCIKLPRKSEYNEYFNNIMHISHGKAHRLFIVKITKFSEKQIFVNMYSPTVQSHTKRISCYIHSMLSITVAKFGKHRRSLHTRKFLPKFGKFNSKFQQYVPVNTSKVESIA